MWTRMEERQGDINRVEGGESSLRKSARSQWRKMRDEWAGGLKGAASPYSSSYNGHLQSSS